VRPGVAALGLAALAGCGAIRTPASTPEDSTYAGPDSTGRFSGDSANLLPDSAAVAAVASPSIQTHTPSSPGVAPRGTSPKAAPPVLSPLADTIAQYLVFDPIVQTWFLSAKRGKRLLLDIGRVDFNVQHDKRRAAAFLQAVKALSPLPIGTPVRIHDAWGVEDDTVVGFGNWNDRIVATVHLSRTLDSLVRHAPAAYAAVERTDTAPSHPDSLPGDTAHVLDTTHAHPGSPPAGSPPAGPARRDTVGPPGGGEAATVRAPGGRPPAPASTRSGTRPDSVLQHGTRDSAARADSGAGPTPPPCQRDSLSPALVLRAVAVRDSIDLWLRSLPPPPYERLVNTERSQSSQVSGCFSDGNRLAIAVDLRAGANEWIRERAVLVDTLGRVSSLRVYDYRFKGHDFLAALDPNGGGVDGIVARGIAEGAGGIVILVLEPTNRLSRWVGGFAWEAR